MSHQYNAEVLNQTEGDFRVAAEAIDYGSAARPVAAMERLMESEAPGLREYIYSFSRNRAERFNDVLVRQEFVPEGGNQGLHLFKTGAFMAFKMVDSVYRNTGATLPDLEEPLQPSPEVMSMNFDFTPPALIEMFYRGAKLRERAPHLYRPSLELMATALSTPAEDLDSNLHAELPEPEGRVDALRKLHFIGGAAETILGIEERATAEAV